MEFVGVTEVDHQQEIPDVPMEEEEAPLQLRPLLDAQDPATIVDTTDLLTDS